MIKPAEFDFKTAFSVELAAIETALTQIVNGWGSRLEVLAQQVDSASFQFSAGVLGQALAWPQGGKRLRPLLVLLSAKGFGETDSHKALPVAVALELLHTYSLVHDDLPCMDDDDLRRGRPTTHKQFDEATAVLVGDALLTAVFEVLSHAEGLWVEQRLALIQRISQAAGYAGLIAGQHLDLHLQGEKLPLEAIQAIHTAKTGALLGECFASGAIIAHQPQQIVEQSARLGRQWGLLFQVVDDILDATATTETLGKTVGKDAEQAKNSLVTILGLVKAQALADCWLDDCQQQLQALPLTEQVVHQLLDLLRFTRVRTV